MHVRADILAAFHAAIDAVPVVASVYDYAANVPPPSGKVTVELGLVEEGPNRVIMRDEHPALSAIQRLLKFGARVTAAVPRDMDTKAFEATVIAPIEVAVSGCTALESLADDWFLSDVEWQPAQDGNVTTLSAVLVWSITYTTAAGAPGKAL